MKKTISMIVLGCFRNTYDSEYIIERYRNKGYRYCNEADKVDVLVVNTCGFITAAKKESIETIRGAVSLKQQGKVNKLIVAGCLVQRYKGELEKNFPEVDEWKGIVSETEIALKKRFLLPSHIAFLKVSEGCINHCSYCAIPYIKGHLRSKTESAIIEEISVFDHAGVQEVNIIGQDTTSWGKDKKGGEGLLYLLKKILSASRNIRWFRLLYTHPRHITRELLKFIQRESRFCKYIDLPLQHINDRILRLMNRKISKAEIIQCISLIRETVPGCALRTSFIVGFPSETEEEFTELVSFIKRVQFEHLGAFIYSREEGTPAYGLAPQLHHSTKRKRYHRLMTAQKEIAAGIASSFIGKSVEVLIDDIASGLGVGRTQSQCYDIDGVVYVRRANLVPGRMYQVKVTNALEYDLEAV